MRTIQPHFESVENCSVFIIFECSPRGGGGYLVCLSDGDVPFFRVSFSPIFSRIGYHLKAKILEQGEKILFRGHIPVQI